MTSTAGDAQAVLALAPAPSLGRGLSRSKIASALRRSGRQRRVEERAAEIQTALRSTQLAAPDAVAEAMGTTVAALVAVTRELNTQIAGLEESLVERFEQPPERQDHPLPFRARDGARHPGARRVPG